MSRKISEDARMLRELLETAESLSSYGVMSTPELGRVRALCQEPPEYTPDRVIEIRTSKARMSQAVFATFLNVSVSTVQKWESPTAGKRPSGAAAKLLQLVEIKGIEALII
ncbi:helix-turn-helix domain-containing protein [Pseudoduganella sp. OTU4001]|uniref:helix-turn-helix domain-containing protein n=1 Tax=Pseudoduganella sp. OTU4001 TaxID=3043854 RepID=UPI00313D8D11